MKATANVIGGAVVATLLACGSFGAADGDAPPSDGGAGSADGGPDTAPASLDATSPDGAPLSTKTVVAVSSQSIPWIALDATRVIWSNGSPEGGPLTPLYACPKTGCAGGAPVKLTNDLPISSISSDGTTVVVGHHSQSRGIARLDGNVLVPLAAGLNGVDQSSVRNAMVWFVVFGESGSFSRTLYRVPLAGGQVTKVATYAPIDGVNVSHVVVAATRAFLGSHSTGNIGACFLDTGTCTDFYVGANGFGLALATDDARVFWGNADTVMSCGVDDASCSPRPELPAALGPAWTVIAKDGALFMTMKSGDLLTCQASNCANTHAALAHGETFDSAWSLSANNVAADDTGVFYVTHVGSEYRIIRVARNQ